MFMPLPHIICRDKTIMIGVQVFIAVLAAETDKDIKHLVNNPIGQQCSD